MNCLTKRQCVFLLFCIIHGSVVFGDNITKCQVDVYKKFPESKLPSQNFLDAFEGYNLRSFDGPRTSDNASGYFQDLVKPTVANENNFLSPQKYCDNEPDPYFCQECLDTLFFDPTLSYRENIKRIRSMSGYEAFELVYLTQIYSEMTLDTFYPQIDHGLTTALHTLEYYEFHSRMKLTILERGLNQKKFDYMMQYYEEFRRIASEISGDNITKCLVDVYKKFPESKLPSQNFLDAFEGYNLRSFDGPRTSDNASGYFQDLVKPTEANENNFLSPQKYCDDRPDRYYCYECLFTLFRDPTLYYRENVIRLGNMSGYEAFKHVYLTHIYSEITPNNYFMMQYYEEFRRIASEISETIRFESVAEYCRAKALNQE